mgnify:CR=1 FL=1
MLNMKRVSLTPAVFHLSERVNKIAEIYAEQPVVPRGPKLKPIMDRLRLKLVQQLDVADTHEAIILTAAGSGAIAATVGSCIDQQGVLIIAIISFAIILAGCITKSNSAALKTTSLR